MKKVLFAAVALCGFVLANAQFNTDSKVSSSPNTLAGPVSGQFDLKVKVYNIIRIFPKENIDMYATFNSADELDASKFLNFAIPDMFIVSSNRKFHVGMSAGPVSVSDNLGGAGGNHNMPLGVFSYQPLTLPGSGVTLATSGWQTLTATQALVSSGDAGAVRGFGVQFKAQPGWNYEGGNYIVPITVTATQD